MWIFGYGSLVWKVDFPYVKKVIGYVEGYERRFWQASIDHRGVPEKPGRVVTLVPSIDPEAKVWGVAYKIHQRDINRVLQHLDHREVMGYEKVPIEFHPIPNHIQNVLEPASPFDYNNVVKNMEACSIKTIPKCPIPSANTSDEREAQTPENEDEGISLTPSSNEETLLSSEDSDNDSHVEDISQGKHFTVMMYYGSSENEHYIGPAPVDLMAKQIYESVGPSGKNKEYLYNLCKAMRQICDEAVDNHLVELEDAVYQMETQYNLRSPGTPIEL